jgi:hypothetical protein
MEARDLAAAIPKKDKGKIISRSGYPETPYCITTSLFLASWQVFVYQL